MANYIIVNGELYHWGIKGMKWGIRRARKEVTSGTFNGPNKKNKGVTSGPFNKSEKDRIKETRNKRIAENESKKSKKVTNGKLAVASVLAGVGGAAVGTFAATGIVALGVTSLLNALNG